MDERFSGSVVIGFPLSPNISVLYRLSISYIICVVELYHCNTLLRARVGFYLWQVPRSCEKFSGFEDFELRSLGPGFESWSCQVDVESLGKALYNYMHFLTLLMFFFVLNFHRIGVILNGRPMRATHMAALEYFSAAFVPNSTIVLIHLQLWC